MVKMSIPSTQTVVPKYHVQLERTRTNSGSITLCLTRKQEKVIKDYHGCQILSPKRYFPSLTPGTFEYDLTWK